MDDLCTRVTYGKGSTEVGQGQDGRRQLKDYLDGETASAFATKIKGEKRAKGYRPADDPDGGVSSPKKSLAKKSPAKKPAAKKKALGRVQEGVGRRRRSRHGSGWGRFRGRY